VKFDGTLTQFTFTGVISITL